MPTYRVNTIQPIGIAVTATAEQFWRLTQDWCADGYYLCDVEYKGREPGETVSEKRVIPWHMVACIDPVPFPKVDT